MITDYADKLHLYGDLQEYADMVLAFIEKQKKENLPAGRYDLENGVFCLCAELYYKTVRGLTDGIPQEIL